MPVMDGGQSPHLAERVTVLLLNFSISRRCFGGAALATRWSVLITDACNSTRGVGADASPKEATSRIVFDCLVLCYLLTPLPSETFPCFPGPQRYDGYSYFYFLPKEGNWSAVMVGSLGVGYSWRYLGDLASCEGLWHPSPMQPLRGSLAPVTHAAPSK